MRPLSLSLLLLLSACGGQQSLQMRRIEELESRLESLQEEQQAQHQRLRGLYERVELLKDQQESQTIAQAYSRRALPVVKLQPSFKDPDADERPPLTITPEDLEKFSRRPKPSEQGSRPHKRLPKRPVAPPENAKGAGNIGVAPLRGGRALPLPPLDPIIAQFKRAQKAEHSGRLKEALSGYQRFLQEHPKHAYSDNALFNMGQCRFRRVEFAAALKIFRRVIQEHPRGNKVPDALLMMGLTQRRMGRIAESREILARLVAMYPDTAAAKRAATEIAGK